MILRALYALAERERLVADPDFPLAPVAWLVTVSRKGRVLTITDTRTETPAEKKGKPRLIPRSFPVPRQPGRTSGRRAFFFVDKSEYALGIAPDSANAPPRPPEELAARFSLFRDQIRDCVIATKDEGAAAVLAALDQVQAGKQQLTPPADFAGNDLFGFIYQPDGDLLVHQRPAVQRYWRSERAEKEEIRSDAFECMVTGKRLGTPGLFPKVKYVPGGQTSGTPLVSFNASAFASYGLSDNENAPISREAAEACATALQRLLHPAFPDPAPEHFGELMPRRNLRLSDDTALCYWVSEKEAEPAANTFADFFEPQAEEVEELYRSVKRGRIGGTMYPGRFYALTLSGAQGRMIVRDWFESSVAETLDHMNAHFNDLAIVQNTPAPKGGTQPEYLALHVLLGALAPFGRKDAIPAALATDFVNAALRGTPYPLSLLQRALERSRAEVGKADWTDLQRRDARAALIKAVLNRRGRLQNPPRYPELTVALDTTNDNPGYLCGRLMAVIERLQQAALGDVNASVIDRFFGAASATPRGVFTRLLRNARHHARKAKDEPKTAGTARWLEAQIDSIATPFDVKHNGFPAFLDLEQQGLFMLGYHQQRHALWAKRSAAEDGTAASTV
jgi:CRISPR-associated protein Csd1